MHDGPLPVGLTAHDAAARLQAEGCNELATAKGSSLFATLLTVLREPMLLLLLSCAVIYFFLGDRHEAALLGSFVVFVISITLYQDRRTEHAVAALRELASPRALVIRDGRSQRISGREVVRGDLLVLAEGDRIVADGVLRKSVNLCANESLLTGEPVPVRKVTFHGGELASDPGGDDLPQVYAGTLIVSGHGVAEVCATGMRTAMGKIGKALAPEESDIMSRPPRSPREPLFTRHMVTLGIMQGAALLLGCLGTLALALHYGGSESQVRAQTFCTLMTGNLLLIWTNRSCHDGLLHGILSRSSAVLWILSVLALLLGTLALYVPAVQRLFGFAVMRAWELGTAIGAAVVAVLGFEVYKLLRRRAGAAPAPAK